MATAMHGPRQRADVDIALGAKSDLEVFLIQLSEENRNLYPTYRAGIINKPVCVFFTGTGLVIHVQSDRKRSIPATGRDLQAWQSHGKQTQSLLLLAFIKAGSNRPGINAYFDHFSSDLESFRVGIGVTERAGIGKNCRIDT